MTSIIGYISHECVILASDRRITFMQNGKPIRREDTENKTIALYGHFLMGYTGFARLDDVKTELWVIERLAGLEDPSACFQTLADATMPAIKSLRLPLKDSGHAYLAVGYADLHNAPLSGLQPTAITISNAMGSRYGDWQPRTSFSVTRSSPLNKLNDFRIIPIGVVPKKSATIEAVDAIRRYRKRDKGRTLGIVQILVRLIRSIKDEGVGHDVSISILPRSAVPAGEINGRVGGISDPIEMLTCGYVPKERDAESALIYFPAVVGQQFMMYGGEFWANAQLPPP